MPTRVQNPYASPGAVLHASTGFWHVFAERTRRVRRDRSLRQRLKCDLGLPRLLRAVDRGRTGDLVLGNPFEDDEET